VNQRTLDLMRPHGRDLSEHELITVATQIAARSELWTECVSHDPQQRTYEQLLRDEHLDVWLLCWSRDHDTGFHDHDLSAEPIGRIAGAGSSFSFGAADIHRVLHAGEGPAVTIHAYSPPLMRMGSYTVEPTGQLRRHAVSYEEELYASDSWPTPPAARS